MDEAAQLPAWLNGLRWNGWAQPRFEKSTADQIMTDTPGMLFDPERNAYVLLADLDMGRDEEEVFAAEAVWTPDGPVTAIGARLLVLGRNHGTLISTLRGPCLLL